MGLLGICEVVTIDEGWSGPLEILEGFKRLGGIYVLGLLGLERIEAFTLEMMSMESG